MSTRARGLRKTMTDAERLLWRFLRNRNLEAYKFRRQHPIGPFVVDFVCLERKVIIEADGGQHAINQQSDFERSDYLQSRGFRILRFWNNEVLNETEAVLNVIREVLDMDTPSP